MTTKQVLDDFAAWLYRKCRRYNRLSPQAASGRVRSWRARLARDCLRLRRQLRQPT